MIARWAEYNRVLDLKNTATDPSPSYLPDIFSFGVIEGSERDHDDESDGEGDGEGKYTAPDFSPQYVANYRLALNIENLFDVYNAIKGKYYKLRFKMHSHPEYWYARLTVLQFTADGGIHKYYPRLTEYEVIVAGQDCEFKISRHMHRGQTRSSATFKAFITLAPTSFDTVLGSRIVSTVHTRTRDNEFGDNHQVTNPEEEEEWGEEDEDEDEDEEEEEEKKKKKWGPPRDAAPTGNNSNLPPRWRTMSVTIHTSAE